MFSVDQEKLMEAMQGAFKSVLMNMDVSDIINARELPEFLTVAESMRYLKIKAIPTFEKKMEEFNIKTHFNATKNNLKCYKREDIVGLYMTSDKFLSF